MPGASISLRSGNVSCLCLRSRQHPIGAQLKPSECLEPSTQNEGAGTSCAARRRSCVTQPLQTQAWKYFTLVIATIFLAYSVSIHLPRSIPTNLSLRHILPEMMFLAAILPRQKQCAIRAVPLNSSGARATQGCQVLKEEATAFCTRNASSTVWTSFDHRQSMHQAL